MADLFVRVQARFYETEDPQLHDELAALGPSQRTRWIRKLIRMGFLVEKGMSTLSAPSQGIANRPTNDSDGHMETLPSFASKNTLTGNGEYFPAVTIEPGSFFQPEEMGNIND